MRLVSDDRLGKIRFDALCLSPLKLGSATEGRTQADFKTAIAFSLKTFLPPFFLENIVHRNAKLGALENYYEPPLVYKHGSFILWNQKILY